VVGLVLTVGSTCLLTVQDSPPQDRDQGGGAYCEEGGGLGRLGEGGGGGGERDGGDMRDSVWMLSRDEALEVSVCLSVCVCVCLYVCLYVCQRVDGFTCMYTYTHESFK
jgi:hypothetical protein